MSAPLPCCTRIKPIMPKADSICTARMTPAKLLISVFLYLSVTAASACGCNDLQKVCGLEGSPPNQTAINVGLCQQLLCVASIHAAAIQKLHQSTTGIRCTQLGTQSSVYGLRLLRRCCLACANRPHRLIGHHQARDICPHGIHHSSQLALHHSFCFTSFALRQGFTHANDGRNARSQCRLGLGCHHRIGFTVVLATLGMPHQGVAHAKITQHGGRHFTRESAAGVLRHILCPQSDHRASHQLLHLC